MEIKVPMTSTVGDLKAQIEVSLTHNRSALFPRDERQQPLSSCRGNDLQKLTICMDDDDDDDCNRRSSQATHHDQYRGFSMAPICSKTKTF